MSLPEAMGRPGIVYSDVADAAAGLVDSGRAPTVDLVRSVLGSGSKSTIAPLLKRWKSQHAASVAGADEGLPTALLQAIKNVYDGMQDDLRHQLDALQAEHDAQRDALDARLAASTVAP